MHSSNFVLLHSVAYLLECRCIYVSNVTACARHAYYSSRKSNLFEICSKHRKMHLARGVNSFNLCRLFVFCARETKLFNTVFAAKWPSRQKKLSRFKKWLEAKELLFVTQKLLVAVVCSFRSTHARCRTCLECLHRFKGASPFYSVSSYTLRHIAWKMRQFTWMIMKGVRLFVFRPIMYPFKHECKLVSAGVFDWGDL